MDAANRSFFAGQQQRTDLALGLIMAQKHGPVLSQNAEATEQSQANSIMYTTTQLYSNYFITLECLIV